MKLAGRKVSNLQGLTDDERGYHRYKRNGSDSEGHFLNGAEEHVSYFIGNGEPLKWFCTEK